MNESLRGPLVVVELAALVTILAIVDDVLLRISLGLLVGLLLARAALTRPAGDLPRPAAHVPSDRRSDFLYRHWIDLLLKRMRKLHSVCQSVRSGAVSAAVGRLRIAEQEKEIQELLKQVTESAKPPEIQRRRPRLGKNGERQPSAYGKSVDSP